MIQPPVVLELTAEQWRRVEALAVDLPDCGKGLEARTRAAAVFIGNGRPLTWDYQ